MSNNHDFKITLTDEPKVKPDWDKLEFGSVFTDHIFIMDYNRSEGWHSGRVEKYGSVCLDPASSVFHYAQETFEGLKAYRNPSGEIYLFRPDMNAKRMNRSSKRLCMPSIDESMFLEAVRTLVEIDSEWVPDKEGTSLYIRPFMIASEPFLGVRSSNEYKFIIIMSPVGSYYKGKLKPIRIYVENEYVRSSAGGTGEAKCGGNYAAALIAQEKAAEKNCNQVLWLDGNSRKYVEEIGTSNAFFVIDNTVLTPPLSGTILPGITRDSIITLLRCKGHKVVEKNLKIEEVINASKEGKLQEVFASGTAASVSPVGELVWKDSNIIINNNNPGPVALEMYENITGIQNGSIKDEFNWILLV